MATYSELYGLFTEADLRNRVRVAVMVEAYRLLNGTPTADEAKWSAAVVGNPKSEGDKAFIALLAANADKTIAQITGVSDTAIQTQVGAIVPSLVAAFNAA